MNNPRNPASRESFNPQEIAWTTTSGTLLLFGQTLSINIVNFVFFAVVARLLSQAEVGIYAGLIILSQVIVSVFSLGLQTASSRFVSLYAATDPNKVGGTIRQIFKYALAAAAGACCTCLLMSRTASIVLFSSTESVIAIRILAFDIAALLLSSVGTGVLLGLMRFRRLTIAVVCYYIVRSVAGILLLLYSSRSIESIVVGWTLGDTVGAIAIWLVCIRGFETTVSNVDLSHILSYALPVYFAEMLVVVSGFIDKYAVLYFIGTDALAVYHSVLMIIAVAFALSKSIGSTLFPAVARIEGLLGYKGMKSASYQSSRYTFILMIPLLFAMACFAGPLIGLVAGPAYLIGSDILAVLATFSALLSVVVVLEVLTKSSDDTRPFLVSYAISTGAEALACGALVPTLGLLGAAISRVVLIASLTLSFGYVSYKRGTLGIDVRTYGRVTLLALLAGTAASWIRFGNGISQIIVSSFVYALIIVIGFRALRIANDSDYLLLEAILPKKLVGIVKRILG